jgi:hypothetical protein
MISLHVECVRRFVQFAALLSARTVWSRDILFLETYQALSGSQGLGVIRVVDKGNKLELSDLYIKMYVIHVA